MPREDRRDLGIEHLGRHRVDRARWLRTPWLRDRPGPLPDLNARDVRRTPARRQPDRARLDGDLPGPQPLPGPGRAAVEVVKHLLAVQEDAESLRVVVFPNVKED